MCLRLQIALSSSEVVQHDRRSARDPMVTARMPEDRPKNIKNLLQLSRNFKAICTCMCTPVVPTAERSSIR
eukprot:4510247-Heterocapsa_arctica.AAC.1